MHSQQQAFFLESKFGQFSVRKTGIPKPGPGELLVKLEASALNPLDWKIQAYGLFVEKYPAVLGFDAAGVVVEIGDISERRNILADLPQLSSLKSQLSWLK